MSVFGAALIQGHLRSDFLLTAAVRASETRLRAYFEQALIGVALSSPEGNWLEVNDAFCRLVGYTRDELRNMSWADVLHPDDLAPAPPGPRPRGRSTGAEAYSVERRLRRKDGHVVRAVITGRWLRGGDGEPEQLVEMVREWSWSRG
jgi:PAS domain S-box-containing protein